MPLRPPHPKLAKWTRTKSETFAKCRIFDVERIHLDDAQNKPRGDFFTTRTKTDWCNVIAVTDDAQIVLVWQYRFGSDALSLEIPGGVVDEGEAPIEAARRELREETGYEARELVPFLSVFANPAVQNTRCHTFLARGAYRAGEVDFDESEECELALLPVADLAMALDDGTIDHALAVVALEKYLRTRST